MKKTVKSISSLVFLASLVTSSPTIDLRPDNFDSLISSRDIVLTEFYTPWCKVCQEVEPIVEETATVLRDRNVTTARVDCDAYGEFCQDYHIGIFPTFLVFKGLENQRAYNGPREVEEFVAYMEKHKLPASLIIDKDNLESFKNSGTVVILGLFEQDDQESQNTFAHLANKLRDDFDFGVSIDKEIAEIENVPRPSVILYKNFDDGKSVYSGEMNKDDIAAFMNKNSIPWIGQFKPETSSRFFKNGIPLALLVHDTTEERERLTHELQLVAKDYRDTIQTMTLDYNEKLISKLRFKVEKLPALLAINSDNKRYYLDPSRPIDKLSFASFLQGFKDDKLEEYVRSEPIPQQQGAVSVVVRDNFEELVMNNDKDVLVEFYAPWCRFCQAFAPEYEEIGQLYSSKQDQVTIAKLDVTANDMPDHKITSYPTIKLFKASDKGNPLKFEGDRSIENLARFIAENGSHQIYQSHDEL